MSVQISSTRMIFKVLIIGRDLALQTGFLTQVSGRNISTQLFNTLGISLGIAHYNQENESNVVLQLWAIPQNERVAGLSKTLSRGYKAVIVVVRPDEVQDIPNLFNNHSLSFNSNVIITILGPYNEALQAYKELSSFYVDKLELFKASDTSDIINHLAQKLTDKRKLTAQLPVVLALDESMCPAYEHPIHRSSETECTDEEIDVIRNILLSKGLQMRRDTCVVNIKEGEARVSLRTGSVRLEPAICNFCLQHCKRDANVCIIAVDSGWSSQGISEKALLIAAKIIALAERNLPQHVESQIQHVCQCAKFLPDPEQNNNGLHVAYEDFYPKHSRNEKSLLEAAEERMKEGRLPQSAFYLLKKRLLSLDKSNSK
jgi:hypothetical protein